MKLFSKIELYLLYLYDTEVEDNFVITTEEIYYSNQIDKDILFDRMSKLEKEKYIYNKERCAAYRAKKKGIPMTEEQKRKKRESDRKYREKNRERINALARDYKARNKDKIEAQRKARVKKKKELANANQ